MKTAYRARIRLAITTIIILFASPQQTADALQSGSVITAILPDSGKQGTTVSAKVAGVSLAGASSISFSGSGLSAAITGAPNIFSPNLFIEFDSGNNIVYSKDGKTGFMAGGVTLNLIAFDVISGQQIGVIPNVTFCDPANIGIFDSGTSRLIAIVDRCGPVTLVDATSASAMKITAAIDDPDFFFDQSGGNNILFSANGAFAFVATQDSHKGKLIAIDTARGVVASKLQIDDGPRNISMFDNGSKRLISALSIDTQAATVVDATNPTAMRVQARFIPPGRVPLCENSVFDGSGQFVFVCSETGATDRAYSFNAQTGSLISSISVGVDATNVVYNSLTQKLAVANRTGSVSLLQVGSDGKLSSLSSFKLPTGFGIDEGWLALSGDGLYGFVAGADDFGIAKVFSFDTINGARLSEASFGSYPVTVAFNNVMNIMSVITYDGFGANIALFPTGTRGLLSQVMPIALTISSNAGLGPRTFTLSLPGGAISSSDSAVSFTVSSSGSQDTTPPTVSITSPIDGAFVKGTVDLTASPQDNVAVAGVQFKADGNTLGAEITSAPYTISLDTKTLSDGPHTISAIARDTSGNISATASIQIIVDNTPPQISITNPHSGASISGSVIISATATDNISLAGVQFAVDGNNLGSEITTIPFSAQFNSSSFSSGQHIISATARDAAGNRASTQITVTVGITIKKGDANLDGKVDVQDLIALIQHLSGAALLTGDALLAADTDGNGEITVQDLIMLIQILLGIISS